MLPIQLLNTRPSEYAYHITETLVNKGLCVQEMPLLTIQPCLLLDSEVQYLKNLAQYDLVICISTTAVTYALSYIDLPLNKNLFEKQQWIAVGETTQKQLMDAGISAAVPLQKNNEGMLVMPKVEALNHTNRVLILKGEGGRELLINDLQKRQVQVDCIALYKRLQPIDLLQKYQAIQNWANVILISSGESWKHWLAVCKEPQNYSYLVLGKRVQHQIQQENSMSILINDLHPETIYTALQQIKT